MAFSKVMVIGNLGRDPEMRYTPNGRPVTEFSVAVTHRGKDAQTGEWSDQGTDWYRVSVWGDRAERAAEEYRKGNRVFVEGRFRTREYEAKDGQKRTSLEISADNIIHLERRSRDDEGSFGGPSAGGQGGGSSSGGFSSAGSGSGGGSGQGDGGQGGGGGGNVRPQRPPSDDTDLDDLPF